MWRNHYNSQFPLNYSYTLKLSDMTTGYHPTSESRDIWVCPCTYSFLFFSCLIRFTYLGHTHLHHVLSPLGWLNKIIVASQSVSQSHKPEAKDQYLFYIVRMWSSVWSCTEANFRFFDLLQSVRCLIAIPIAYNRS
jgi:hypothetical protein